MSHTQYAPVNPRLQRSVLVVPACNPSMIDKALASAADCVLLDLEDAVALADKPAARRNAIQALNDLDWAAAGKSVSLRVNGLDTPHMYRDVIEVVEQAGGKLDSVMLPKAGVAADVYLLDGLLSQIEMAVGLPRRIGIEAQIETTLGLSNVEAIAQSSPRLEALHYGGGDFAASCGARTTSIGGPIADYPGDAWHAALSRLLWACRAYGLRPIDGPYGDFRDADGTLAAARRTAVLGYAGKWAIHPGQIAPLNREFTPPAAAVAQARRILAALEEAASAGRGAAQLDGRMLDAASARMAEQLVRTAEAISAKS